MTDNRKSEFNIMVTYGRSVTDPYPYTKPKVTPKFFFQFRLQKFFKLMMTKLTSFAKKT